MKSGERSGPKIDVWKYSVYLKMGLDEITYCMGAGKRRGSKTEPSYTAMGEVRKMGRNPQQYQKRRGEPERGPTSTMKKVFQEERTDQVT